MSNDLQDSQAESGASGLQDRRERPGPLDRGSLVSELDAVDREILSALQTQARLPSAELARRIGLSAAGLKKRLRKLEGRGVIQAHVTLLDREAVGYDLLSFVQVTLASHRPELAQQFGRVVQDLPEVLECYRLTGEYDYLLKVVVRDHKHLEHFLMEGLPGLGEIDRVRTSIVLNEVKSETALPLGHLED